MQTLTKTKLRPYQSRAYEMFSSASGIVVLPTGSGKTLIGCAISSKLALKKTLFLVPTCLLVSQQGTALRLETNLRICEFVGGQSAPRSNTFDVLVCTPAAFLGLSLAKEEVLPTIFGLVVFDEVHHVLKKHPYRTIASIISTLNAKSRPQILGLTASLSYAFEELDIKKAVESLCFDLNLEGNCIFTASKEELINGGYHSMSVADVVVKEEFIGGGPGGQQRNKLLEIPAEPHSLLHDFLNHVEAKRAPIHPLTLALMDKIAILEKEIQKRHTFLNSPVRILPLSSWVKYIKSSLPANEGRCIILEQLYEAAKIIVNSRQKDLELAYYFLKMQGLLANEHVMLETIWQTHSSDLCKLENLLEIMLRQEEKFKTSLRCIVFVQQRVTAHILQHYLSSYPTFHTGVVHSTTKATTIFSVSPSQSRERIANFAKGLINVLIATTVAEEGMDIPSANCVVRFDPIQTPVSLVQSRGRARMADSSFVVLQESKKRTVTALEESEVIQQNVIEHLNINGISHSEKLKKLAAQKSRQIGAANLLLNLDNHSPMQVLHNYAQKVKGDLTQNVETNKPYFKATLTFREFGEGSLEAFGLCLSKKAAVQLSASNLLEMIRSKRALN